MMSSTRMRGLRELNGSWNTTCTARRYAMSSVPSRPAMSRPSKAIEPAVGVSCNKINLEVVVFPHPDSPMRPSVSPGWIAKSTPSTALTHALPRPSSPVRTGKCFFSPRTSRTGSATVRSRFVCAFHEPAPGDAPVAEVEVPRLLVHAAWQRFRAARMKRASRGQVREIGWLTRDRIQGLLAPELRHRAEQGSRVRVLGVVEELPHRRLLDDLAGIHHGDPVTHLRHDAQVVRHEDQRHAGLPLDVLEEVEILRLDGDVEIRRGLVGNDDPRPAGEGDRADDALAHAAAHLMGIFAHPPLGRRDPDGAEEVLHALPQRAAPQLLVEEGGLRHLPEDGEERVQRRHGVLEDHGDPPATDPPQFTLALARQIFALEDDPPSHGPSSPRQEPDDREARRRLAASRLADEPQGLAFVKREAHAVPRPEDACPAEAEEVRLQLGHGQDGIPARHGFAGARRALGGLGGHVGAPQIHKFLSWGSSRTRNQSPKSWVARTIRRMQNPGNTVSHHWPAINVERASESMRPQAGCGGGTPTPRKLSEASAMMTTPTVRLARTVAVFMTFGRICRLITRSLLAPAISASFTNSRSRRVSTSPRMTRAYRVQYTAPRMTTMVHMLGPTMAARKIAKTMAGNASQASVTRMMIWSTQPPTYPARIPIAVPMLPATSVPISPTISDTRAPWIRRLRMSRPWKSVPSSVAARPPSIQNGGSNTFAPCTGSVGSYGAMRSAKIATSMRPPRMTMAACGASRTVLITDLSLPAAVRSEASRVCAGIVAIVTSLDSSREPDSRVDEGVENVYDQVDPHDHEAGHDHDALHQREVPLEDPLVEQATDARPREDHLDDDGGVDHHDHVDAGQREDRDERVLERVHGDDHDVRQPLEPGELDVLAAQHLQHARAGQSEHRRGEVPPERQGGHDDVAPVTGSGGRQPSKPDGEHQDQHEPQPEPGNREAEQGHALRDVVPPAVHLHRRDDAGRNADDQGDERGGQTQGQRVGQPLEVELADREPIVEGLAELPLESVLHEGHVLHGPRAVQSPLLTDPVEIFGARAGFRHERHRVPREPDDEEDRRAQNEERDEAVDDAPDDELRHVRLLVLHLQVLPGIGIARGDRREDVLPFLRHDPRADRVDERVAEHRHEVVVFQNAALDFLGEPLSLCRIDRPLVLVELRVEVLHADAVARVEAAALEVAFVPERPASRDPDAVQDDLGPRKLLEAALEPLEEDAALHGLEPAADTDLTQLRDEALAPRVERGERRDPVHVEPVRVARLAQELLGPLHVAWELGPLDPVQDVVVDPVARRLAHPTRLRLVHGPPVDSQAHRLAHALVAERVLRILEPGKLDEERAGQHRRQHDPGKLADLVDELAGHVIDDVGLAALEHGDTGGRLRHRDHDELLHVDGTVVAVEGLHLDLHTRLVAGEVVGARSDRLLL